jgi:hypothetical protein
MSDAIAFDRQEVISVLDRYAEACDTKRWELFDDVFVPDAVGDFGAEYEVNGRDGIVRMVASHLGGCGPTQHLLGNYSVEIDGDQATATCKVRAFHLGAGAGHQETYEVMGEYHDRLVRRPEGWRISHRRMAVSIELGTRAILRPAPEAPG